MGFPSPTDLVKTLAKNLVKNPCQTSGQKPGQKSGQKSGQHFQKSKQVVVSKGRLLQSPQQFKIISIFLCNSQAGSESGCERVTFGTLGSCGRKNAVGAYVSNEICDTSKQSSINKNENEDTQKSANLHSKVRWAVWRKTTNIKMNTPNSKHTIRIRFHIRTNKHRLSSSDCN